MANQEHVDILKQGAEVWNKWRKEHAKIQPDVAAANLYKANVGEADLSFVNLGEANFSDSNLSGANFTKAYLGDANLCRANLSRAVLTKATLSGAILRETFLDGAIFNRAEIGWTVFGNVDLRLVKGLDSLRHRGPSSIGIDTIVKSHGHIPETFLRQAGIPQSIIEQIPALIGSLEPIQYYTCFISCSSKDQELAERLYADLQAMGVRCWYAQYDLRTGQRIRYGIDEAVRQYEKLLLVLSKDSIASTWVEFEVEAALDKEKNGSEVLFPIRLDSTVLDSSIPWAKYLKQTRHICDFTYWKSHEFYQKSFSRLLRDLKANT